MQLKARTGFATVLIILGLANTVEDWGAGLMSFRMDGQHKVTEVESGAARAGVRVGDVLTHIDTVDVNARVTFLAQPRAGEIRSYVFVRGDTPIRVDLLHEPPTRRGRLLGALATLAGVVFIVFPLWAATNNLAAIPLTTFGLGFGAAILGAPEFGSNELALIVFNARWLATIIGAAGFVHFLMSFPVSGRVLEPPKARLLVYVPAVIVLIEYIGDALDDRSWARLIGATWFFSLLILLVVTCVMLIRWFRAGADSGARAPVVAVSALTGAVAAYGVLRIVVPAMAAWTLLPPWTYFALSAMTGVPIVFAFFAVGRTTLPLATAAARVED